MMQNFHYTLEDLEGMMSWERRIYIELLMQHLKEEKERMEAWNLTALTMMSCDEWVSFFNEVGFSGDYYWFIP